VITACYTKIFDLMTASEEPTRDNMTCEAPAIAQIILSSVKFSLREVDFVCALSNLSIDH